MTSADMRRLGRQAASAARLLTLLGNERRLLILCFLAVHGEVKVGKLAEAIGLGKSALSQHLARLREEGLVAFRRDSQTLYYRIADPRASRVLALLKEIYCGDVS